LVGIMPLKFATESLILLGDPSMSVVTTPVRHMLERTAKAVLRGLALDDPTASPGLAPVVGEPEKVEGRLGIAIAGRLKADQLGLGWMQGQSEPSKALWQDGERSEEHTSELQSLAYLVCRLLLEKKKK